MGEQLHAMRRGWLGAACGAALLAAACGGGSSGGGGGGLDAYAGVTTAADITAANATTIASSALGAATFSNPVLAQWSKAGEADAVPGTLLATFGRRPFRARLAALGKAGDGPRRGKDTFDCGGVGDGTYTVDDRTNADGVGKVIYQFFDCNFGDGVVINGKDTDNTTSDTSSPAGYAWAGHESVDVGLAYAGADYVFQLEGDYDLDQVALEDTYSGDYALWDTTHGMGFRSDDAVSTYTFADAGAWTDDCAVTAEHSARFFDGSLGFVDGMTTTPLVWTTDDCDNPGPSSGGPIVLDGAAGDGIVLTPQSDTDVEMAVDADGDKTHESVSTVAWAAIGVT